MASWLFRVVESWKMGVVVRRERPDQRRHHRVGAPFYITFGLQRLRVRNWSLGGFLVHGIEGRLPALGEELEIQCSLPFQGFEVSFDCVCTVVRHEAQNAGFAAQFTQLGERERELMSHFIEELVRGAMSEVADTIQRIDVPVTPASLEPKKPVGMSELPVQRWPVKAIIMAAFYGCLGLGIFSYAGLLAYTNLYRLEVQTAVISAPIEMVSSQIDGRIEWAGKRPGDVVQNGDVVVRVIDNQLEREIELAEIAVKERQAQLLYLRRRQVNEYDRMRNFTTVETKELEQARLEVEAVEVQLQAAEQQYGRLSMLHRRGFTTDLRLEEAEKTVATLKKQLESRRVELKSRVEIANQTGGKWHYTGQNMVGEIGQIEAQVKLAEHEVQLADKRRMALINHRERLAVQAPFEGTVLELPHVDRGMVRRGDVIAVIEQRRERQVTAYLNQDEVGLVGLGDEVLIYVPALGETLKGRVRQIDRTSGFVREQSAQGQAGYRWRSSNDRSAVVVVEFKDAGRVSDIERYRAGLPVVVVFPQRSQRSLSALVGHAQTLRE